MTLDPNCSITQFQQVISQDQALSAKMLRIVNSAMYAFRREVSTVSHAVAVLGLETVKSVIMAASVERVFNSAKDLGTKIMSDHSWGTALAARAIARRVRYENPEEALVCGLMHDIGKPVLLQNFQRRYREIISEVYRGNSSFHQVELLTLDFRTRMWAPCWRGSGISRRNWQKRWAIITILFPLQTTGCWLASSIWATFS